MNELEKALYKYGITRSEVLDILTDYDFGNRWNTGTGKSFRKAIIDALDSNPIKLEGE